MAASNVGRVMSGGRSFHGGRVVAFVAPGSGNIAFVTGRRVGGAVVRNRARRVLRAAWRELEARAEPDADIVLVARPAIRGAKTQDLVAELNDLLTRARVLS
jgi:ribonuclease P protein component